MLCRSLHICQCYDKVSSVVAHSVVYHSRQHWTTQCHQLLDQLWLASSSSSSSVSEWVSRDEMLTDQCCCQFCQCLTREPPVDSWSSHYRQSSSAEQPTHTAHTSRHTHQSVGRQHRLVAIWHSLTSISDGFHTLQSMRSERIFAIGNVRWIPDNTAAHH